MSQRDDFTRRTSDGSPHPWGQPAIAQGMTHTKHSAKEQSAKQRQKDLDKRMAEFLARGGEIQQV